MGATTRELVVYNKIKRPQPLSYLASCLQPLVVGRERYFIITKFKRKSLFVMYLRDRQTRGWDMEGRRKKPHRHHHSMADRKSLLEINSVWVQQLAVAVNVCLLKGEGQSRNSLLHWPLNQRALFITVGLFSQLSSSSFVPTECHYYFYVRRVSWEGRERDISPLLESPGTINKAMMTAFPFLSATTTSKTREVDSPL